MENSSRDGNTRLPYLSPEKLYAGQEAIVRTGHGTTGGKLRKEYNKAVYFHPAQTSLVAQMVKCLPTMWETQVQSLGWEDLLEKEMATHSSILAWKIPWTKKAVRLQSMGLQRVGHD